MTISTAVNAVRMVTSRDLPAVERVLAADPVANCFVACRITGGELDQSRLGGELLGYVDDYRLTSLLYAGANLVLVGTTVFTDPAAAALRNRRRVRSRWLVRRRLLGHRRRRHRVE